MRTVISTSKFHSTRIFLSNYRKKPYWESEPFDFLIKHELVRMSIEKFLLAKNISAQREIESNTERMDRSEVREWRGYWRSNIYGLWSHGKKKNLLYTINGLVQLMLLVPGGESVTVATASKDRTLRLWKFNAEETRKNPLRIRAFKILSGHTAAVQSVAAQTSGNMSCSWDSTINLWQTNEPDAEGDTVSTKKRKKTGQEKELQLEVCNCIDIGGEGSALIAAGGSDPIVRVWDPCKPGTSASIKTFSSHTSWVTACKWHDKSPFHLVSASHDGKVMLWDTRTAWPLFIFDSHKDKALCADWWKGDSVLSGGADFKLCMSPGFLSLPTIKAQKVQPIICIECMA
ncbi:unnamed protein product [Malus baccata var. baccata]